MRVVLAVFGTAMLVVLGEIRSTSNRPKYRGVWTEWGAWDEPCRCIDHDEVIRTGRRDSRRRTRECPCPSPYGCYYYCGPWYDHYDEIECTPVASWLPWGDWSACSVKIGSGEQKRQRQCSSPGCEPLNDCPRETHGPSEQTRACGGGWAEWQEWDACQCRQHAIVGVDETRRRVRLCGCLIPQKGADDTNEDIYPTTIEEREQDNCPLPCGPSESTYNKHSGVSDENGATEHVTCEAADWAYWDEWQQWQQCSVSMGKGLQSRQRTCSSLGCQPEGDCNAKCTPGFDLIK